MYDWVKINLARSQLKLKSAIARIRSSSAFWLRRIRCYRQCAKRATLENWWTFVNLYIFYVFYIMFLSLFIYKTQFWNDFFCRYELNRVSRSGKQHYCSRFQIVVSITYFPSRLSVLTLCQTLILKPSPTPSLTLNPPLTLI